MDQAKASGTKHYGRARGTLFNDVSITKPDLIRHGRASAGRGTANFLIWIKFGSINVLAERSSRDASKLRLLAQTSCELAIAVPLIGLI